MEQAISKNENIDDTVLDNALRPKSWKEFIGQDAVKRALQILLQSAQKQHKACDHILFSGPSGVGKTTLAYLIARELGAKITVTSGPAIQKSGDVAALLSNLEQGVILFIDEAHRLNKHIEEMLYPAMESRTLHLIIGKGISARSLELKLPSFTLIAATTRPSLLSNPLRNRFGSINHLDYYETNHMEQILKRSSDILHIAIDSDAISALAYASRATPRIANRLLKRTWDLAIVENKPTISFPVVKESLEILNIDSIGLENIDRKLLHVLVHTFNGGPVGVQSLAATLNEERETIESIHEPYLIRLGLIERTGRGRIATPETYRYLNMNPSAQVPARFDSRNKSGKSQSKSGMPAQSGKTKP